MKYRLFARMVAVFCFTSHLAHAEILIGQTAGLTGPTAAAMKEINAGANLYFESVNRAGGIQGQPIKMISMDDKFDPKLAVQNAQELIDRRGVLALFLSRGTPQTEALLPLLAKAEIALVAPSTGAMSLHQPLNPFVFNVRATYQSEANKGIVQLSTMGLTRIGVIYRDDSFGKDGLAGAQIGFAFVKLQPLFAEKVDRTKPDFAASIALAKKLDAQAVMILESPAAVARAVGEMRAAKVEAQVITLSNCASKGFIEALGDHRRGVMVTQVFPSERARGVPMIAELAKLASAKQVDPSPATVEGFAAAKVLVEGLRRLKGPPSRKALVASLDSLSNYEMGGLTLSFSPTDHTGLKFSDLSIIDGSGKFLR
jgi:branched-chain amino acid transport system substrate-binding protein